MKIPFSIEYRPQIESGEYKLETECGHPVSIMDWEWINRDEKKCLAVKVLMDEGFNIGYLFDYDGKRHSIFPSDSDSDLFIITPEPELSEFEKACMRLYNEGSDDGLSGDKLSNESLKESASELLELAKNEILRSDKWIIGNDALRLTYERGKAEALKDLPRWSTNSDPNFKPGKYFCVGNALISPQGWAIFFKDLEKLPGFKED